MTTWIYIQSEKTLFTVGFYDPQGKWHSEQDYASREIAAERVHYLNGNAIGAKRINEINVRLEELDKLIDCVKDLGDRIDTLESASSMAENVAIYLPRDRSNR